ncbi:hypothetical protein [Phenylobacterium deserti]|uniref:Uncharacterized protein n=1 Tax=Phenylobacterium deserti TaxID=1914756 RepID=A0A328ASJ9_9CAUL|nr:hypothetical protein [Phenylobacterium deserti]RAK56666.1 hypothetical protein DJ018_01415 [Phenylobacterium deserti]
MAYVRKKLPAFVGEGELRYRGFQGQVAYEIQGEPTTLKAGPSRLRGSLTATPEVAKEAFREGEGVLTLETGAQFRITLLGHSSGSDTAYFEMRV